MSKTIKKNDIGTILFKGAFGAIPFVGPLMAEVVGAIIPNQRIDRIENVLEKFEKIISKNDQEEIKKKLKKSESIDILEDTFIQSSRALSEERKKYIASLLKNSLTREQLSYIEYKRLFSLLGELNDIEVLILKSKIYLMSDSSEAKEFWEKHGEILEKPRVFDGDAQENINRGTLYKTHNVHLVNLGLLKPRFSSIRQGELPKFDNETGMIKASG